MAALRERSALNRIDPARPAIAKENLRLKTNCANRARSCGAGSTTVPTFMSAATPVRMAADVAKSIAEVIAEFGAMDIEAADESF